MANDMLEYRSALASPGAPLSPEAAHVVFSERPVDCIRIAAYPGGPGIAPDIARIAGIARPCGRDCVARSGAAAMMQVAPDTWHLVVASNAGGRLALALNAEFNGAAAVTPFLGGGIVEIMLSGRHVHVVLEKGIGIDFSLQAFGIGHVAATGLHEVAVTVVRHAVDGFQIYVARSFACSIQEWLEDAAREFNV